MTNPAVLYVPVEKGLELMPPIGANSMDAKRELSDNIINEIYGVLLSMTVVNLQGSDPSSIVDGSVLEATYLPALSILESKKGHIDLDMVAWNLFGVAASVERSTTSILR